MKTQRILISLVGAAMTCGCITIDDLSERGAGNISLVGEPDGKWASCLESPDYSCDSTNPRLQSDDFGQMSAVHLLTAVHGNGESSISRDVVEKAQNLYEVERLSGRTASINASNLMLGDLSDRQITILRDADAVLIASPVQRQIIWALVYSSGVSLPDGGGSEDRMAVNEHSAGSEMGLALSRNQMSEWTDDLYGTVAADGFSLVEDYYALKAAISVTGSDEEKANLAASKLAEFANAYTRAYFRNGKFASIRFDAKDLEEKIVSRLEEQIPEDVEGRQELIDELTEKLLKAALGGDPIDGSKYKIIGEIGDTSFVTRAGVSFSFPALTVDVNPYAENRIDSNEIDYSVVGAELIRVFVEAMGDAWIGLPADESSTAAQSKQKLLRPLNDEEKKFFSDANEVADKIEGLTGAATGRIIRGISWFSLNNESLAEVIETAVAVAVRKGTEKLAWCYYKCRADNDSDSLFHDPGMKLIKGRSLEIILRAPRTNLDN